MFVMEGMGAEGKALVIPGDCGVTWPLDEADPVFLMRQAFSETSGRSILRQGLGLMLPPDRCRQHGPLGA